MQHNLTPRIVKVRGRIKSVFDNSCMFNSFMDVLARECLNYIIFAPIIIGGEKNGFARENRKKLNGCLPSGLAEIW